MDISIAAKTDPGKERDQNEDAFIFCPDLSSPDWTHNRASVTLGPYGCLLCVADGIGGANNGETASKLATDSIKRSFSNSVDVSKAASSESNIKNFLAYAIKEADLKIKHYATGHPDSLGLGTTIVVCWILNNTAYIAWCGDSRCYLFNPKAGLLPLTKDHSYVQELVDKGELTKDEAFCHPESNIITRALGDSDIQTLPDIVTHTVEPEDIILLCSDGLCGYCSNQSIEEVIRNNYSDMNHCCNKLLQLSLDTGGYDNICILLASLSQQKSTVINFFKHWFSFLSK